MLQSTSLTFRQLQYNHNQLMEEKKRMEEYFDEVDHDVRTLGLVSLPPSPKPLLCLLSCRRSAALQKQLHSFSVWFIFTPF